MNNKEELSQREQYYMKKINKRDIAYPIMKGLRVLAFATLVPCTFYTFIGTVYASTYQNANQLKKYIELGQEDKADELIKDRFSYYQKEDFDFYGLSHEQQLEYIKNRIGEDVRIAFGKASGLLLSCIASIVLFKILNKHSVHNYTELNELIYQFYLDEKCRQEYREVYADEIDTVIEDLGVFSPDFTGDVAKERAKALSFEDDVPFNYNDDYKLGFEAGEINCWTKYHDVAPISEKVVEYVNKNGYNPELDKIVLDCAYQKGANYSQAVCKVINIENGEALSKEEEDKFFEEHQRPLEDSFSYWQGYCRGYIGMLSSVSTFSAGEYKRILNDMDLIEIPLDDDKIQSEFYRGLYNGMDEIEYKKEDESLSKS